MIQSNNSAATSTKSAKIKKVKINGKEILVKPSAAGETFSAVLQQSPKVDVSENLEAAVKWIEELVQLLEGQEQQAAEQEERISALAQQLECAGAVIAGLQVQRRRREDRQLRPDPLFCRHFLSGRCTYGSQCKFRHTVSRARRRSPAPRPPPSSAPSARTARPARSPSAASSSTSKLASVQQVPQSPESHSTPTLRSAGKAYNVNPDLLVVDEEVEHIMGSEKPAAILHNEKQDKMPAPAKFEDKYRFSPYPRPSKDKFMSGLAKFINEYEEKEGEAAPRADELWIVVTRRRSSRRSPRRRSRRREATPDASKASIESPS